jgi:hypothetical protein
VQGGLHCAAEYPLKQLIKRCLAALLIRMDVLFIGHCVPFGKEGSDMMVIRGTLSTSYCKTRPCREAFTARQSTSSSVQCQDPSEY